MAEIKIGKEKTALIDDKDADIVGRFKWFPHKGGKNIYARAYIPQSKNKERIFLHSLIMGFPDEIIDHVNTNGLDCRRQNLREATRAQNGSNRNGASNNSKSGIRGVYWHKRDKKWCAKITANGKDFHLGYFDLISDAAKAYNSASLKFHGEFGRLNPVE